MSQKQARIFSLAEVNALVAQVANVTAEVVRLLDRIRERYGLEPGTGSQAIPDEAIKEIEEALNAWNSSINDLGAYPKGYFTVDFQSRDPELLYCWSYGEDKIEFAHKTWENFTHRRPLAESVRPPSGHLRWVN
jgi:hypothetical protein